MKLGFRSRMMLGILVVAFLFISGLFLYNSCDSSRLIEQNYIAAQTEKLNMQMETFDTVMQQAYELSVHMGTDAALCRRVENYLQSDLSYDAAADLAQALRDYLPENSLLDAVYLYLPDAEQIISSKEYYTICPATGAFPWKEAAQPLEPVFFRNAVGRLTQQVYA